MIWLRALAIWLLILLLAIGNGILRASLLIPWLGTVAGLVCSGLLLISLILLVTWLSLPWLALASDRQALQIGLLWLLATLLFEFGFGWSRGLSLEQMLTAYRFEGGNLWPLVLLVTALAPWLACKLRRR